MFTSRTSQARSGKERRPAGVSRRSKRQFTFEALEDRRVMSAQSPVAPVYSPTAISGNYSSDSAEGAAAVLALELYWQALISANQASHVAAAVNSIPTDPFLSMQWHLINSGQAVGSPQLQPIYGVPGEDLNVAPVWNQGLTGRGVRVAVLDSGVQRNHPDLAANIDPVFGFDAITGGGNGNPTNVAVDPLRAHGTAVAGLIGAVANNGIGGAGVAPGVTLVPIRLIDTGQTPDSFVDAFRYLLQADVDISNNSWGPAISRALAGLTPAELTALRDTITFGRDGLGMIHVFSSGNSGGGQNAEGFADLGLNDSSVYSGWQNSRYTITVGGVDHDGFYNNFDGTVTAYPEAGPGVLVVAPTGSVALEIADDTDNGSGIFTTDVTGRDGFNAPADPLTGQEINDPCYPFARDFFPDANYTSRFNGTSASAPLVSGVIALMLEANPNLSWRDVQEILVRSARQNGEFDLPGSGIGGGTQNLWIINQQPIFRDPDPFGTTDPFTDTFDPSLQPAPPTRFANGAGYTVSQGYGFYGEQLGYGHGVIDAELAVALAQQWSLKGQSLAPELTFTTFVFNSGANIPAAEKGNDDSGMQYVPGGIGGEAGFIDFWNEYFADEPFSDDDPPTNTRGASFIPVSVPASNTMSVETVEVKVSISGGTAAALDHLRITLVSPSGTHSELNHHWWDDALLPFSLQTLIPGWPGGEPGSQDLTGGNLVWSFTTNRHWGERSDGVWQLHIENYDSSTAFALDGFEVAFHGSPLGATTQRIMGFVGVDEVEDDVFEFSPFAETPEPWASNVTVQLRNPSNNEIVEQFVVGADGNYYFDVVPGNYIITVDDPLDRTANDDSINPTPTYLSQWSITAADFTGVSTSGFNFLLDPGDPIAQEATFTGAVYADVNGDGHYNGDDVYLSNITIYADVNRNGARDAGELTALTDANGNYSITVPITSAAVINIAVQAPVNWTPSRAATPNDPNAAYFARFAEPGSTFDLDDFALKPPANNIGGGNQTGFLLGVVYNDANGNGTRGAGETGTPNVTVYIDANNSGSIDLGDTVTTTNEHGAFAFSNVTAGQKTIRIIANSPLVQTAPANNLPRNVTLTASSTISGIQFGVRNTAVFDFGDLPAIYGATTLAQDGARHRVGGYYLGAPGSNAIDAELDGFPGAGADGDDTTGFDDEQGISFGALVPGGTTRLVVQASQSGYLQGWIDWNNDGDFNDVGERVLADKGLVAGANEVFINVPAGANVAQVYSRFRFGAFGINSIHGSATFGEVEDYRLTVDVPVLPPVRGLAGDADGDGDVDGNDFLAWQQNLGKTSGATQAQGDANGDGKVDAADLAVWKGEHGSSTAAVTAPATGDFDDDGDVDGNDFLQFQRGLGLGHPTVGAGDGNRDGVVNSADLAVWSQQFGQQSPVAAAVVAWFEASAAASTTVSSTTFSAWAQGTPSVGVTGDLDASSPVLGDLRIREAFAGRPFVDVASRVDALRDLIAGLGGDARERAAELREEIKERLADAKERWLPEDWSDRRDRAFDDLFGTRRRQGLRVEAEAADDGDAADSDEAFALLADHEEVPV